MSAHPFKYPNATSLVVHLGKSRQRKAVIPALIETYYSRKKWSMYRIMTDELMSALSLFINMAWRTFQGTMRETGKFPLELLHSSSRKSTYAVTHNGCFGLFDSCALYVMILSQARCMFRVDVALVCKSLLCHACFEHTLFDYYRRNYTEWICGGEWKHNIAKVVTTPGTRNTIGMVS